MEKKRPLIHLSAAHRLISALLIFHLRSEIYLLFYCYGPHISLLLFLLSILIIQHYKLQYNAIQYKTIGLLGLQ